MPLTMRPTGLGHGVYKDVPDYSVFCGDWCIGRIYETRTGPESLRWFWALHAPSKPGSMRTSNQVATLDCQSASDRDPRSASKRDPFVLPFEPDPFSGRPQRFQPLPTLLFAAPETVVHPRLDRSARSSMREVSRVMVCRAIASAPRVFDLI